MDNNVKNELCELNVVREMYSLGHKYSDFYIAYRDYKIESIQQYYCARKLGNPSFSEGGLLQVLNSISIYNENVPHKAVVSPNVTFYHNGNILSMIRSNQEFDMGTRIKLFDNCRYAYYQDRNVFDELMEGY